MLLMIKTCNQKYIDLFQEDRKLSESQKRSWREGYSRRRGFTQHKENSHQFHFPREKLFTKTRKY